MPRIRCAKPLTLQKLDLPIDWWQLDTACNDSALIQDFELPYMLNYEYARSVRSVVKSVILQRAGISGPILPFSYFLSLHISHFPRIAYHKIPLAERRKAIEKFGVHENSLLSPSVVEIDRLELLQELHDGSTPTGFPTNENFLCLYVDFMNASDEEIEKEAKKLIRRFLKRRHGECLEIVADRRKNTLFGPDPFKDDVSFAKRIKHPGNKLESFIRNLLPVSGIKALDDWNKTNSLPKGLGHTLANVLNTFLEAKLIVKEWQGANHGATDLLELNLVDQNPGEEIPLELKRRMLEEAFRDEIFSANEIWGRNVIKRQGQKWNRREVASRIKELGALRLMREVGWKEERAIDLNAPSSNDSDSYYYSDSPGKWKRPMTKAKDALFQLMRQWSNTEEPYLFLRPLGVEDAGHRASSILARAGNSSCFDPDSIETEIVSIREIELLTHAEDLFAACRELGVKSSKLFAELSDFQDLTTGAMASKLKALKALSEFADEHFESVEAEIQNHISQTKDNRFQSGPPPSRADELNQLKRAYSQMSKVVRDFKASIQKTKDWHKILFGQPRT